MVSQCNTDRIFCSTPHVGEYFLLYPRNVEPPPYSSHHKNDVSCRKPLDILYQRPHPPTSPTAPKLPSRSVSTEMQPSPRQRSPRLPSEPQLVRKVSRSDFVCVVCVCFKHRKESTNSVSARSTFGLGKLIFSTLCKFTFFTAFYHLFRQTTSHTNFPAVHRQATVQARVPGGRGRGESAVRGSGG